MYAPAEETIQAVRTWLISSGIPASQIIHSDNKGWIAMDIPAWRAEELFQTAYHEHVHSSGAVRVGSDEYYLPEHIREHVDYITPGIKLSASLKKSKVKRTASLKGQHTPGPKKSSPSHHDWTPPSGSGSLPSDVQNCGVNITIACLKALYDIPDSSYKDDVNVMGLYESGDVYAQEDLNSYFAAYAPYVPQGTHPALDSIDGGQAPVTPDSDYNTGESDIDMDIAFSLIHVSQVAFLQCVRGEFLN
jgi:tripeptidyl-peptidase-1